MHLALALENIWVTWIYVLIESSFQVNINLIKNVILKTMHHLLYPFYILLSLFCYQVFILSFVFIIFLIFFILSVQFLFLFFFSFLSFRFIQNHYQPFKRNLVCVLFVLKDVTD